MPLTLDTPILELHRHAIAQLSAFMSKKLAAAVALFADKSDPAAATVEDLLNYFPMRYEDRSSFLQIDQLFDGIEATVELYTGVSGGYRVGRNRDFKKPALYIFEVSGSNLQRTQKPVVVFWFISGKGATQIIEYYSKRFARGTHFAAFGKWEWDARRRTFVLKLAKPDELEVLPTEEPELLKDQLPEADAEENLDEDTENPEFAKVHTARGVPVYRKLGQFQTKRLREIIFDVVQKLDKASVTESLPSAVVRENDLLDRAQALIEIHFPPDDSSIADY